MTLISEPNPLVSVIITTFNRVKFLDNTLSSIYNQTYFNIEILVIDDGSRENVSTEYKNICAAYSNCTYYYKENSGQPDSRNYGIKKSKGKYIAFCDDDDYWVLDKLEKQVKFLEENKEYGVIGGCVEYVDEKGGSNGIIKCKNNNEDDFFLKILKKNQINSPTPLVRRAVFDKVGYFNPNFTIAEDWEFWRRVAYFFKIYNCNSVLAFLRLHDSNMTKTRTSDPLESFSLYSKLTLSLIEWGKPHFKKIDYFNIYKTEWKTYRKILTNRCPGILNKLKFLIKIFYNNPKNAIHFVSLFLRFEKLV